MKKLFVLTILALLGTASAACNVTGNKADTGWMTGRSLKVTGPAIVEWWVGNKTRTIYIVKAGFVKTFSNGSGGAWKYTGTCSVQDLRNHAHFGFPKYNPQVLGK